MLDTFFRPFSIKSNVFNNEFVGFILIYVSNLCIRVTIIRFQVERKPHETLALRC